MKAFEQGQKVALLGRVTGFRPEFGDQPARIDVVLDGPDGTHRPAISIDPALIGYDCDDEANDDDGEGGDS